MTFRRKTVALHVGAHKTGTSLVQKYMRDNVRALRRRRIYYVSRGAMNDYVGWGGKLLDDPEILGRKIRQVLRIPWFGVFVASHENTLGRPLARGGAHLYPRAPEIVDALEELLRPYRPKIIYSIRPQAEFLESYYLQSVHEGRHETFQNWLSKVDLDAVSWRPVVDKLVAAFGADNVEIIDFRLITRGQEAYISEFLTRIDPRHRFPVDYGALRNPSISEKGLRMALAANPHLKSGEERKLLRKFLQKHFSNARYPRPALLSEEQRSWLRERYGGEYEALVGGRPVGSPAAGTADAVGR